MLKLHSPQNMLHVIFFYLICFDLDCPVLLPGRSTGSEKVGSDFWKWRGSLIALIISSKTDTQDQKLMKNVTSVAKYFESPASCVVTNCTIIIQLRAQGWRNVWLIPTEVISSSTNRNSLRTYCVDRYIKCTLWLTEERYWELPFGHKRWIYRASCWTNLTERRCQTWDDHKQRLASRCMNNLAMFTTSTWSMYLRPGLKIVEYRCLKQNVLLIYLLLWWRHLDWNWTDLKLWWFIPLQKMDVNKCHAWPKSTFTQAAAAMDRFSSCVHIYLPYGKASLRK